MLTEPLRQRLTDNASAECRARRRRERRRSATGRDAIGLRPNDAQERRQAAAPPARGKEFATGTSIIVSCLWSLWNFPIIWLYQRAGGSYKFNQIDYQALAGWSRSRKGFIQVCEADGADWLPFKRFATTRRHRQGGSQHSVEALFELEGSDAR